MPALRDSFLDDSLDAATRRLIGTARELRNDAIRDQVDYVLHLDLDSGSYWISSTDMTPEKLDEMRDKAKQFPSGVRIVGVSYHARKKRMEGEATIAFLRQGYVQPAVVHLTKGERMANLVFQPFGRAMQVYSDYGGEGAGERGEVYAEFR